MSSIDVLIITHNEVLNLPHCLSALTGWVQNIYVIDSGSTDGTQELARQAGAHVHHHDWPGYAAQRNWALDHLPLSADWTLILDADEVVTPELKARIQAITSQDPATVHENGFFLNRLSYFLGEPIRHCGYFPSWNLRLFKRGQGRYENRSVHEHVVIEDPVGYIREPMTHHDRRGIEHFFAKHNRYSTLEASELFREIRGLRQDKAEANLSAQTKRRRWLKRYVSHRIPFPSLWRFIYMYVFRFGFLDGKQGFRFCQFIAAYDGMVSLKLRHFIRSERSKSKGVQPSVEAFVGPQPDTGLAIPEGNLTSSSPPTEPEEKHTPQAAEPLDTCDAPIHRPPKSFPKDSATTPTEQQRISVLILTLNEEDNLQRCLDSVSWADDIVVLDSGSTDRTVEIAKAAGARVYHRAFDNERSHREYSLRAIEYRHPWVYNPDADEVLPPALRDEMLEAVNDPSRNETAYRVRFKNMFMGRWIRRSSLYPVWVMRLFRPDSISFRRKINLEYVTEGEEGYFKNHFEHYSFNKGIAAWFEKHNLYSTYEASETVSFVQQSGKINWRDLWGGTVARRRMLKQVSYYLPFRAVMRFLYMYIFRLGVLDGRAGLTYCIMISVYEYMIVLKVKELRRRDRALPM
ncbi:MAG: glycosyltransferase family 2 protein [Planctomycetota bacterium]